MNPDFSHQGRVNFVDNAVDPATGTIHLRAVLDNADRRLVPGLMARVRLPGSADYTAVLVPDAAVATDQDRRYVLVVGHRRHGRISFDRAWCDQRGTARGTHRT